MERMLPDGKGRDPPPPHSPSPPKPPFIPAGADPLAISPPPAGRHRRADTAGGAALSVFWRRGSLSHPP
eukprot:scaffold4305_cov112-Isochrysis_galbana.AAC.1